MSDLRFHWRFLFRASAEALSQVRAGRARIWPVVLLLMLVPLADSITPAAVPAASHAHYVGSEVCGTCHAGISRFFRETDMGKSMVLGNDSELASILPAPATIYDKDTGLYYEVTRKGGHLYQEQYLLDMNGKQIFHQSWKLEYAIGAGENGYGFIVQRQHYLFEAPLCFYTKTHTWGFSPGYEFHNYGFARPILAQCIACHSSVSRPIAGKVGLYADPPFKEMAIGCETCHGPGSRHVSRVVGQGGSESKESEIVNPARLSGWLADNICMRCHQGEDVRVYKSGAQDSDFRPGTPLNRVLSIFKVVSSSQQRPSSAHLEYYYGMTTSKCYRSTQGGLHCITCHDPHRQPSGSEKIAYYRSRCLTCHTEQSCTVSREKRSATNPSDNCISCHMPKRSLTTITHSSLTDHSIPLSRSDSGPANDEHVGNWKLILLTEPFGKREDLNSVPPIEMLETYDALADKGYRGINPKRDKVLNELSHDQPHNAIVLRALARKAAAEDTPRSRGQAIEFMEKAIHGGPSDINDSLFLADLYSRQKRNGDAVRVLKSALVMNPYIPEIYERLGTNYMALEDYRNALFTLKEGLELFPGDRRLRLLGKKAESVTINGLVSP